MAATTTAAFVAINSANSANTTAAAAAAAERARQYAEACAAWIPQFVHEGATVDQMRYYASCVAALHPAPSGSMDPVTVLWLKATVLAAFVGLAVGAWRGATERLYGGFGNACALGMAGLVAGPGLVGLAAGLWYGGKFLLS